jgi:hypothetical protein
VADVIIKSFKENKLPNGEPIYAIEEKEGKAIPKIRVYPNPASTYVKLDCDKRSILNGTIDIFNVEGTWLTSTSFATLKDFVLPVDNLVSGFYFLRITTAESASTLKLVITR